MDAQAEAANALGYPRALGAGDGPQGEDPAAKRARTEAAIERALHDNAHACERVVADNSAMCASMIQAINGLTMALRGGSFPPTAPNTPHLAPATPAAAAGGTTPTPAPQAQAPYTAKKTPGRGGRGDREGCC